MVNQAPVLGFLASNTFGAGAEQVGEIVADFFLVGHTGQPTGARQHSEQWYLGQADGAAAVIDQQDFIAGQREFITTPGAGTVDGGQKFQSAVRRAVLKAIPGLVREFTKIHFPCMTGDAEHEDVGA